MDLFHFHLPDYNQQIMQVCTKWASKILKKKWSDLYRTFYLFIFYLFFVDGVNKFRVSKQTGQRLPNPRVISNRLTFALGRALGTKNALEN